MELNYLREFVALAETCNFLETADDLFISQSSLSKHIKAIEHELGKDLFTRTTRRVELTEFGKSFLPYAAQIASIQKEYTEYLLNNNTQPRIRIGFPPIMTLYTLKDYLFSEIFELKDSYCIDFEDSNARELVRKLLQKDLDIIVIPTAPYENSPGDMPSLHYSHDYLVAFMSKSHPLAQKEYIEVEDLHKYPLLQKDTTNFARAIDSSIPAPKYSAGRNNIFMEILEKKKAIAILPHYTAKTYTEAAQGANFIYKDLQKKTNIEFRLYYQSSKKNSKFIKLITAFLENKEEYMKKLL